MADTKQDIMDATYAALCEHGLSDLSIQDIAEEMDAGKSLVYYHYEDKEELLLAFMDWMSGHIEKEHQELEDKPPRERLNGMLDLALGMEDEKRWEFQKAFLEMRAQASHSSGFAEKFSKIDNMVLKEAEDVFRELGTGQPGELAKVFVSCIEGAASRKASARDREGLKELRESIKQVLSMACGCDCFSG
ncbi:MAG: TetR/AcrR family transcriptional regulator [Candidatus Nanohaloarchaea archaeon]